MAQAYGKPVQHNPVIFYLRTLLYMCIAMILRLVTFAPLVCLVLFPVESPFFYLAFLCPLLFLFFLLPLRFSFAQALVQPSHTRFFSFDTALGLHRYGEKLGESLLHLVNVLKWGIPLAAMLAYGYYCYDNVGALSLMGSISTLGENATKAYHNVLGFLAPAQAAADGGFMEGLYTLGGMLGLGILLLLFGAMRNSAGRYIWAVAAREDHNPRTETRRRLRGRRFQQLLAALINLLLFAPFLILVGITLHTVFTNTVSAVMMALASSSMNLPELGSATGPLLIAFFGLYLPLLPLRRMVTAYFVAKKVRSASSQTTGKPANAPAVAPGVPMEAPIPAYVPTTSSGGITGDMPPSSSNGYYTPAYSPSFSDSLDDDFDEMDEQQAAPAADTAPVAVPSVIPEAEAHEPRTDVDSSAFTIGQ